MSTPQNPSINARTGLPWWGWVSVSASSLVTIAIICLVCQLLVKPTTSTTSSGSTRASITYTPDPTFATLYTTLKPTTTEPDGTALLRVPLCEFTKKGTIKDIELTLEYAPIQGTTPANCPIRKTPMLFVSRGTTPSTNGNAIGFRFADIKPEQGFRTSTFAGLSWDVQPGDKLFFGVYGCASQQYGATVQAQRIKITS